ncbi:hypothetical protein K2Z84_23800 [Candidatus Binatia bacterium]|nr:hypothetical protein [Candidatus Binatia bacterium]
MDRGATSTTYTYDDNDRLLTETTGAVTATYTYDDNGNLASRTQGATTETYTFDGENRLVDATTAAGPVSYTYDADGMRTSKTVGAVTTSYLLDKNRELAQVVVETTGATVVTYTYGNQLVSQSRPGEGTHFYLADGQLSTRQLTNAAGVVSDIYTYDAFGVALAASGTTTNSYQYTGEQFDPNLGFYYLRARYYAPAQGRFVGTDPAEGNIFDPVSLHRYLYVAASPVDNVDPTGRELTLAQINLVVTIVSGIIAAAVGFGVGYAVYRATNNLYLAVGVGVVTAVLVFVLLRSAGLKAFAKAPQVIIQAEQEYASLQSTFQVATNRALGSAGKKEAQELLAAQVKKLAQNPQVAQAMLKLLPKPGSPQAALFINYLRQMLTAAAAGAEYIPPIF